MLKADRTIGARLSSLLTTKYGERKLSQDQINITLRGSAGQSLGALPSDIKIYSLVIVMTNRKRFIRSYTNC